MQTHGLEKRRHWIGKADDPLKGNVRGPTDGEGGHREREGRGTCRLKEQIHRLGGKAKTLTGRADKLTRRADTQGGRADKQT